MRRSLLVLTLVLGGLAAAYGALAILDLLARSETRGRPIALGAGPLRLDTGSADVELVTGTGPSRLEVRSARGLFGGSDVAVGLGPDGVVSVDTGCNFPAALLSCGATLRVVVAAGTPVELETGSGNLTVTGIRGGLTARTGSGDVELRDVTGQPVVVDTGSGNVSGEGLDAATIRAETGSGDVDLGATRAPGALDVETGSGNVEVVLPDVGYRFAVDTGSGDERIDVRQDPASARLVRVQTGSGDVRVGASGQR